jgi:heat shock protein HslJ
MKANAVLILALVLALVAAPLAADAQSPGDGLIGRTWSLLRYGDIANPTALAGERTPIFTFGADGVLRVSPGCNYIEALYHIAGDRLRLGWVSKTAMACTAELDWQDSAVLEELRAPSARFALEGNQLKIFYAASAARDRGSCPYFRTMRPHTLPGRLAHGGFP